MNDMLDDAIARRFEELESVGVPDTWPGDANVVALAAPPRRRWIVPVTIAATVVAVVAAATALLPRGQDDQIAIGGSTDVRSTETANVATTTSVAVAEPAPTGTVTTSTLPAGTAVVEPEMAAPGNRVVLRVPTAVDRLCVDILDVYDATGVLLGQIVAPDQWVPAAPGVPPTVPACGLEPSADPVEFEVPVLLDGPYRVCVEGADVPENCASLYIAGDMAFPVGTVTTVARTLPAAAGSALPTVASPAPTTTLPPDLTYPVVITDGTFLGVAPASRLPDADLSVQAATAPTTDLPPSVCANTTGPYQMTFIASLFILWETDTSGTPVMTNWMYLGASIDDQPQMITDRGITVGSTRADLFAAYPEAFELGPDAVELPGMRAYLADGRVAALGRVDCGD